VKIDRVKKLEVEDRFLYWIKERESIRIKKEAGEEKPWSNDEILQQYKFCNVRRMDDCVSRWLMKNWYKPNYDHPNMLIACFVARLFNQPDALEAIGFPDKWRPTTIKHTLQHRAAQGSRNFNAAYIVSTNGLTGDKVEIVVDKVLQPASKVQITQTASLRALAGRLTRLWGISTFMAGQVSADVRWAIRGSWRDKRVWAPVGPGSRRGINRLLGQHLQRSVSEAVWEQEFAGVREMVSSSLSIIYGRLEAIDVQNCLCEFDKYERTLWGTGRPKRKYDGI